MCLFGDHVWTKNRGWKPFHIVKYTSMVQAQALCSTSSLFCRFVAVIIQLYGGYFSSASFGASINVGLSTGHDFAVREGSRHFHVFPNGYKRMWDNVEWGFQLTGHPRRCLGDFVGHAARLGLDFLLSLVANSLFCLISCSFMVCKLEKKILRKSSALK